MQSYCRACKKLIDRDHNRRKPRRNYGRTREHALRNMTWLHEYLKRKKCEWPGCGVSDPDMHVFDHLNAGEKRGHVSSMAHISWGLKSIQEGVAKCRVLCPNDHQKHMIRQFGYKKWLTKIEAQKKLPYN